MSYNMMPWDKQLSEIDRSIALTHQAVLSLEAQALGVQARLMARRAQMARAVGAGGRAKHEADFSAALEANTKLLETLRERAQRLASRNANLHQTRAAALRAQARRQAPGKGPAKKK